MMAGGAVVVACGNFYFESATNYLPTHAITMVPLRITSIHPTFYTGSLLSDPSPVLPLSASTTSLRIHV